MTEQEIRKFRKPMPESVYKVFERLGIKFIDKAVSDKYGVYSTGYFEFKGKEILINIEAGKWHLSVNTTHPIGYYELKEVRYKFLPNDIYVGQIFPPREEFVNIAPNCFHLYELNAHKIQKKGD